MTHFLRSASPNDTKKNLYIHRNVDFVATLTTGASVGGDVSLGADARVGALSVHTPAVAADPWDGLTFVGVFQENTQRKTRQCSGCPRKSSGKDVKRV